MQQPEETAYCVYCGQKIGDSEPTPRCAVCGSEIKGNGSFCGVCGAPARAPGKAVQSPAQSLRQTGANGVPRWLNALAAGLGVVILVLMTVLVVGLAML